MAKLLLFEDSLFCQDFVESIIKSSPRSVIDWARRAIWLFGGDTHSFHTSTKRINAEFVIEPTVKEQGSVFMAVLWVGLFKIDNFPEIPSRSQAQPAFVFTPDLGDIVMPK